LNSLTECIFLSFRIFEQLALALKSRVSPKFFTVLKYFLLFRNFEQLAVVLKTKFALKFFTGLKYFLSFRNFEQLVLALKTEFSSPPPLASYAYVVEDENTIFYIAWKMTISKRLE